MNPKYEQEFLNDVDQGLSHKPKYLSSKYFYDEEGDRLFQKIMQMPEYYLTDSEFEVFVNESENMSNDFDINSGDFEVIELVAGDAFKSKVLLKKLIDLNKTFKYIPVDISANVIELLKEDFSFNFPEIKLEPKIDDYFKALHDLRLAVKSKKIVLFLGSNIGNFDEAQSEEFFRHIAENLHPGDLMLTGFDLKKHPKIILAAYNDKSGITRDFNLNLLKRINRELDADFNISGFIHYPIYDPGTGAAKSYLVSESEQNVYIGANNKRYYFEKGEPIYMEISQKYNIKDIAYFADKAGFQVVRNYFDSKKYFANSLWRLKS